jgi:hypothetical protein
MKWADISGKSKQRRIQSLGSAGRETAPSGQPPSPKGRGLKQTTLTALSARD